MQPLKTSIFKVFSLLDKRISCDKLYAFYRHFTPFSKKSGQDQGKKLMGILKKTSYTIPIPENATIKNGIVSWTVKGKKKTGTLSGTDKVLCQSENWTAQFIDENGKRKEISTKTKDKTAAQRILVRYESEIERG